MAESVQFAFSVVDQASGPLKQAQSALEAVNAKMRELDRTAGSEALKKMADGPKKMRAELALQRVDLAANVAAERKKATEQKKLASEVLRAEEKTRKQRESADAASAARQRGRYAALTGVMQGIAQAATEKMLSLAAAAGGVAVSAGQYAVKMAVFKENTLFAMKYIVGGQQQAAALFDEADRMARALGGKTSDVATQLVGLRQRGFNQTQSEAIIAGMADLGAQNPNFDPTRVTEQIAQMKDINRVTYEDLKKVLQGGAPGQDIMAEFMKLTDSKSEADVMKKMAAGKIKADEGIAAILRGIQNHNKGGPLGSVAQEFSKTTSTGAFERMKSMGERMFLSLDTGPAGSKFVDMMNRITDALDPTTESGKKTQESLNKVADSMGKLFKSVDSTTITGSINTVIKALDLLVKTAQGALGALSMLGIIKLESENADHHIESDAQKFADDEYAKRQKRLALESGVPLPPGMTVAPTGGLVPAATAGAAGLNPGMNAVGQNAAAGLADGLVTGSAKVSQATHDLTQVAIDRARADLDMHSPSKVFATLGMYTAGGFAGGLAQGTPGVQTAMTDMMAPPDAPYLRAPELGRLATGAAASAGRAGATIGEINVNVTIEGAEAGAASNPRELADLVSEKIVAHFENIASELGSGLGT